MAVLGFLFFVSVLAIAVWAMFATIAPRASYIAALLSGSTAAPVLVPVAQRRRVSRMQPLTARAALTALPAVA